MKEALYNKVPVLGICLGCQLLAECVGGKAYQGLCFFYNFFCLLAFVATHSAPTCFPTIKKNKNND